MNPKKKIISASMMCADFIDMRKCVHELEQAKIELMHFDIMDGSFVPNYTLGACVANQIRSVTKIPFDYHLMIDAPESKLNCFDIREGDYVSCHYEAMKHSQKTLAAIREKGAFAGIALNPGTSCSLISDLLDDLDFILIMTVNPGFSGQKMVKHSIEKISLLRKMLEELGYPDIRIEVDGNVSFENARLMSIAGADIFTAGTSGLFRKDMSILAAAETLRENMEVR